jgi:hypothetical protein
MLHALIAKDSDFAVEVFPTRELAEQAAHSFVDPWLGSLEA